MNINIGFKENKRGISVHSNKKKSGDTTKCTIYAVETAHRHPSTHHNSPHERVVDLLCTRTAQIIKNRLTKEQYTWPESKT